MYIIYLILVGNCIEMNFFFVFILIGILFLITVSLFLRFMCCNPTKEEPESRNVLINNDKVNNSNMSNSKDNIEMTNEIKSVSDTTSIG